MKGWTALLLLALAAPSWAQIAIRAGALVDPRTGTSRPNQTILIEGKKITAVGASIAVPSGARLIDLSHEWVSPGLMDAHTHLTLAETGGSGPFESFYLAESTAYRALRGLHNGEVLVRAGFTTVRDVGNSAEYAMVDVDRAIGDGWFMGPTIIDSGRIIAPYGGQSHGIPAGQGEFWRYEYIDADGPDQVRKAVRVNIYHGARVIKLVGDNNPYHYSLEEISAAVDEAHRAGVPVAIHVIFGGEAADNAIEAGVDSLEHGFYLTDAQLKRMATKGVTLVSTDFPRFVLDAMGTSGGILPEPAVLAPLIIDRLRRAHQAGVHLVFGSDVPIDIPGKTRAEVMLGYLDVWTAAGIRPAEILRAMTSDAARLLRVEQVRGVIAPGLMADLIATPKDPTQDITTLRQVDFVMKEGQVVTAGADRTASAPRVAPPGSD